MCVCLFVCVTKHNRTFKFASMQSGTSTVDYLCLLLLLLLLLLVLFVLAGT
jgi:hypothetical protein